MSRQTHPVRLFGSLPSPSDLGLRWEKQVYQTDLESWTPTTLAQGHFAPAFRATITVDGIPYLIVFMRTHYKNPLEYQVLWDLDKSAMSWWWGFKSSFNRQYLAFARTRFAQKKGIGYTLKVLNGVFVAVREFLTVMRPDVLRYFRFPGAVEQSDDKSIKESMELRYDLHVEDIEKFYNKMAGRLAHQIGYEAKNGILLLPGSHPSSTPHIDLNRLRAHRRNRRHHVLPGLLHPQHQHQHGRRILEPKLSGCLLVTFLFALLGIPVGYFLLWLTGVERQWGHGTIASVMLGSGCFLMFASVLAWGILSGIRSSLLDPSVIENAANQVRHVKVSEITWHPPLLPSQETMYEGSFTVADSSYFVCFVRSKQKGCTEYHFTWDCPSRFGGSRFSSFGLSRKKRLRMVTEVLAHVLAAMQQFSTTLQPAIITFNAGDDQELQFTSQLLARHFAHELGYRLEDSSLVRIGSTADNEKGTMGSKLEDDAPDARGSASAGSV